MSLLSGIAVADRSSSSVLGEQRGTSRGQAGGTLLTFVTYRYVDPMVGLEAFRLLVPKGWQAEGAITWSAQPALPAQSHFRFSAPDRSAQLELFPAQSYFWTDNRLFLSTNPPGSLRFGTPVAQPVSLAAAFSSVILPTFRPNISGSRIVERKRVPELEQLAKGQPTPGVRTAAEGGKIRIVYQEGRRPIEEEIYAVVSQFVTDPGGYFIDYWYIDYVFAFRAGQGQLDAHSKTFQTMILSLRVNPRWFAKVVNTKEYLAQMVMRNIKAVGRIGEIAARAGSEMRADQQAAWEQRQRVNDKISQNFSDYIRGVDRYNDPFSGKEIELPSGYGTAWANNLGEYVVTDSPGYNPNVGSNLTWQPMPPKP
jgi:hypothetical protein